jgi:hypothetical protein
MSGHRTTKGPIYKPKPWRWGPAGWYCCGNRLMAAGTLQSGAPIHRCLHCGIVIAVASQEIQEVERPGPPAPGHQAEQLAFHWAN